MKINYRFLIFYKLIFLSVIFFQSCNDVCSCKKVSCPGYNNPDFDKWFPYDSAEKIIFTSGNANDTAFINYVSQRQPYEANKGCYHSDMGCTADKSISSNIFNVYYHINKDWDGTAVDSGYTLNVYNFSIFAKKLDDEGLQIISFPSKFYTNIQLNDNDYKNVQVIYNSDTLNEAPLNIFAIYLQKNTGVLAYQTYPAKTLFVKK